jgi:hypothetical protein
MQLTVTTYPRPNYFHEIAQQAIEQNLVFYASEAAAMMQLSGDELITAVKRAMDVLHAAGYPAGSHFKRIFTCSARGLLYDWKLSVLAYHLVMLNGDAANPNVAQLQVRLLKKCAEAV